jgi:hypothetical protein
MMFHWNDYVMRPLGRDLQAARKRFKAGYIYWLTEEPPRTEASHRHYFAAVNEAWNSLPERFRDEWWAVSAEHLRKYALIMTGHCKTTSIACKNANLALYAMLEFRERDHYSMVSCDNYTVHWSTALSQDERHMKKKAFEKSKQDVLDYLAQLIGVPTMELIEAGKQAA